MNKKNKCNQNVPIIAEEFRKRTKRYYKHVPKAKIPKPIKRNINKLPSGEKAWNRITQKYDATSNIYLSPVKHTLGMLMPLIVKDDRISGYTWILNMSESFYYDNILRLISTYFNNDTNNWEILNFVLRNNYQEPSFEYMGNTWINVKTLGSGTFGEVFRVEDRNTGELLAIKYIKPGGPDSKNEMILDYLQERNHLNQAYNSPFVLQMKQTFSLSNTNGFFLVLEWCIGDLEDLMHIMRSKAKHSTFKPSVRPNMVPKRKQSVLHKIKTNFSTKSQLNTELDQTLDVEEYFILNKELEIDTHELMIIYVYELFCMLDFLAKCNLIHRDIKPGNIMVNINGHLKLGDFGLTDRTEFVTGKNNVVLLRHNVLEKAEEILYMPRHCGTPVYMDPESIYLAFRGNSFLDNQLSQYPDLKIFNEQSSGDFLSDAWAIGETALKLMLLGRDYILKMLTFNHEDLHLQSPKKSPGDLYVEFIIPLIYDKSNYKNYLKDPILSIFQFPDLVDLCKIILECLLPKKERCGSYISKKKVRKFKLVYTAAYVDIDKLNKMEPFHKRKFNPHNIVSLKIGGTFIEKMKNKSNVPDFDTFKDFLRLKVGLHSNPFIEERVMKVQPGINYKLCNK